MFVLNPCGVVGDVCFSRQPVDAIVEEHRHHVDVVADSVNPVRGADRAAVAIAHHHEDVEIGTMQLHSGGDR